MFEYLKIIRSYISHRKLRSLLTIIGVFIGITAVVALISVGQGMQNFIDEQFKTVGSNRIVIVPGRGEVATPATTELVSAKLYERDVNVVKKTKGVEYATGFVIKSANAVYDKETKNTFIFGIPTDPEAISQLKQIEFFMVEDGRHLRDADKYNAVAGYQLAKGFFEEEVKINDKIIINGYEFRVVGIGKKTGNPVHDRKITIPLSTAKDMFNSGDEVSSILVTVKDVFDPSDVADDIKERLRKDRGLKEGEEDFSVQTAKQMIKTFKTILNIISLVLIGIAAISLLVGGVGIMNTMYTSVLERTRDIGIMKAIGAKNVDILLIFLTESGILGLAGGVIGIILGAAIGKSAEIIAVSYDFGMFKSAISLELALGALLFSFLIGALSGLMPALEASRMKPAEAFRYRK